MNADIIKFEIEFDESNTKIRDFFRNDRFNQFIMQYPQIQLHEVYEGSFICGTQTEDAMTLFKKDLFKVISNL